MLTQAARTKIAEAQDRERERLTGLGVRAGGRFGLDVRIAAIRAFKRDRDPARIAAVVKAATDDLVPTIARSMTAAYLTGLRRAHSTAVQAAGARQVGVLSLAADPFDATIDFLQSRLDAPDSLLAKITRAFGPEATTVTGRFSGAVERSVSEAVIASVREGEHVNAGVARLRKAFDAAGVTPRNSYSLQNLFRTQTAVAYSAGQWQANQDPAIDDIVWGYQYVTVGDDRVRANHAALDGMRAPKDDPRWKKIFPPCGYSCRCVAIEIFKGEPGTETTPLRPVRIDGELTTPEADEGWDFNPGEVYAGLLA